MEATLLRENFDESELIENSQQEGQIIYANELFERVKHLLSQDEENELKKSQKENSLKGIVNTISKKINKQWQGCTKEFIGLLVVFVYVVKFRSVYYHSLTFHTHFFLNINLVLKTIYSDWNDARGTPREQILGTSLFTLLFALGSIVEQDSALRKKMSLKKFFNPIMMTTFLSCTFPDNAKILHFYKILLLECSNRKEYLPQTSLLITSAFAHISHLSSTQCKAACLFVLNRSLKTATSFSEQAAFELIKQLRKIIFDAQKKLLYSLTLSVGSKLVQIMKISHNSFLNTEEFLQILTIREEQNTQYKDITGFMSFLKVLKSKCFLNLMKTIFTSYSHAIIARRIINQIISYVLPKIFMELLEIGLLEWVGKCIVNPSKQQLQLSYKAILKIYCKAKCLPVEIKLIVHERLYSKIKQVSSVLSIYEITQLNEKIQSLQLENYSGLY